MSDCRKVKLIKDHSHLHPSLIVGAIGNLGSCVGMDCNYKVYFPCAKREVYLIGDNFECILTPEEQEIFDQQIQTAYDVVHETGPLGGYQKVIFKHTRPHPGTQTIRNQQEGLKILQLLKAQGTRLQVVKKPVLKRY